MQFSLVLPCLLYIHPSSFTVCNQHKAFKHELRALWNSSSGAAPLTDDWVEAWWSFLTDEWQDESTGTWGARYAYTTPAQQATAVGTLNDAHPNTGAHAESDAHADVGASVSETVVQAHDLSMTFHILSYSHKDHRHAPYLYPELHGWLLSTEFLCDGVYPLGRLYRGRPCAHNDYDVVRIWQLVLPGIPNTTARTEAAEWVVSATTDTLTDQLGGDYVFEPRMGSLFDSQYFGVRLRMCACVRA